MINSNEFQEKMINALNNLKNIFNPDWDEEKILTLACEQIYRLIEVPSFHTFCMIKDKLFNNDFKVVVAFNEAQKTKIIDELGILKKIGKKRIANIIKTQQALLLVDTKSVQLYSGEDDQICACWLGIPINSGNKVVGVIILYHPTQEYVYNNKTLEILNTLAIFIGNAIDKARLYRRIKALAEIRTYLRSPNVTELDIVETIADKIIKISGASNLCVILDEQRKNEPKLEFAYIKNKRIDLNSESEEEKREIWTNIPLSVVREIIQNSEPKLLNTNEAVSSAFGIPYTDTSLPTSWLGLPIQLQLIKKSIGIFALYDMELEKTYHADDIEFLNEFTEQAAIAIENIRLKQSEILKTKFILIAEEITPLKNSTTVLFTFYTLLEQIITAGIEPNENVIFNYIHQNVSELMDTKNMYIALYDEQTDTVRFGIAYIDGREINVKPGEEDEGYQPRQNGNGKTEEIIRTRKPLLHTTKAESEEWYQQHKEYVGRIPCSWVGVPMKVGDKVIGVIANYSTTEENLYNQEDITLLQKMADWAAIALENAHLYAKEKQKTIELEQANQKIAENERFLTRSFIVQDFVHRLNNLAGTIPVWVNLIQAELATITEIPDAKLEIIKKFLNNIHQEANLLLREPERLSANKRISININDILKSIVDNIKIKFYDKIQSGQLNIQARIANEIYVVEDKSSSLSNAFFNIISNGIDAILEKKQSGMLAISTQKYTEDGKLWIKVEIQDTGVGISSENESKIFTPFFTTKESERSGHDKGYGVWRAKNVIENLGGKIKFSSKLGVGTTFTILLPLSFNQGEQQ